MPELPEVETVRRGLVPVMVGRRIAQVEQRRGDLRHPFPDRLAERLEGRRVDAIDRRAKYMLVRLDDGMTALLHLGMSGSILVERPPVRPAGKHDHLRLHLDDGIAVTFNDPRRFGSFDLLGGNALAAHPALATLGPEPLDPDFTPDILSGRLAGRRTPIKAALLDQRVVAGLGNIYVCEALFLARISPRRVAASVAGARAGRLVPAIRDVLSRAIDAGGSTLRDFIHTNGELGYFQHDFSVYDREGLPCPGCDCGARGGIRRIVQAGRSTFYCAARQR